MSRRLLNVLTLLSLTLCIASAALELRGRRHEDRFSLQVGGARYTAVSGAGRVTLYAPPRPTPDPDLRRRAAAAVNAIRNDQFYWVMSVGASPPYSLEGPHPLWDSPAAAAWELSQNELAPFLLAALDDPDRFAAAHALLARGRPSYGEPPARVIPGGFLGRNPERAEEHAHADVPWLETGYDGLTVRLNRWADPGSAMTFSMDLDEHSLLGDMDAGQIPALREQWHRRLDVAAVSLPWFLVIIATALLPALRLGFGVTRSIERAAARRQRRCVECGYDLRATPGRCPECGATAGAATA